MCRRFVAGVVVLAACCMLARAEEPQTLYQKGRAAWDAAKQLEKDKELAKSAAALEALAKSFPTHELADNALLDAGRLYNRMGNTDKAVECYELLVKDYPQSSLREPALSELATNLAYGRTKDFKRAAQIWEKLGTETDGYPYADGVLISAMGAYRSAGSWEDVLRLCDLWLKNMPMVGTNVLGVFDTKIGALCALDRLDEALKATEELKGLADVAPNIGSAYNQIANAYNAKKDYVKASEYFKLAGTVRTYANGLSCIIQSGDALLRMDPPDGEAAIKIWRDFLQNYPKSPACQDVLWRISQTYRNVIKDRAKEADVYKEFMNRYPKSINTPRVLSYLADSYMAQQQFDDAKAVYMQLLDKFPGNDYAPNAAWQLAGLYRRDGDTEKMRTTYEKIVKEYAGCSQADSAARELAKLQ